MKSQINLSQLAPQFLMKSYDYLWLRAMLEKARSSRIPGSTLITGSSHALNGIQENAWLNAINCSMHSQDIFYDFLCAKNVLAAQEAQIFTKCFIVMGYYIAFQDLSLSRVSRETVISNIYYPIFKNSHNWENPTAADPWSTFGDVPETTKLGIEKAAISKIMTYGTYYNELRPRRVCFDLKGRKWSDIPPEEQEVMGKYRAESHNKIFEHTQSLLENRELLKEFIHFLYMNDVLPVVVITPFTEVYNRYVLKEMKEAVLEMLDYVTEDVHFVDFNQSSLFDAADFMDTDHLNAGGAEKVSRMLGEMFGE